MTSVSVRCQAFATLADTEKYLMNTDPQLNRLQPLGKLARQMIDKDVSPTTCWRWTRKGINGIKLETWRVGGRVYSTREAFDRFVRESTAAAERAPSESKSMPGRSTASTQRPESTERRLRDKGLL